MDHDINVQMFFDVQMCRCANMQIVEEVGKLEKEKSERFT